MTDNLNASSLFNNTNFQATSNSQSTISNTEIASNLISSTVKKSSLATENTVKTESTQETTKISSYPSNFSETYNQAEQPYPDREYTYMEKFMLILARSIIGVILACLVFFMYVIYQVEYRKELRAKLVNWCRCLMPKNQNQTNDTEMSQLENNISKQTSSSKQNQQ